MDILTEKPSHSDLPDCYAINLSELSAISVTGEENRKYLHSQLTCDVNNLPNNGFTYGAHCDAKGKVHAVFRLVANHDTLWLIQPKSTLTDSLNNLKKFGVFSKVTIAPVDEYQFIAVAGEQATSHLSQHFNQLPDNLTPVVHDENKIIIYIEGQQPRYIIACPSTEKTALVESLKLPVYTNEIWWLLEILEGIPVLNEQAIGEFVPQMLNVDKIHGISFTKGCYLGQETVARMQYLGKNKRAMYCLIGTGDSQQTDVLEYAIGDNWRRAGQILHDYCADNGIHYCQAVLANDLTPETTLRFKQQDDSTLTIQALPY